MRSSSGEYAGGMVSADLFFFSCVLQAYLSKSCSMVTNRTHYIWQIAGFSRGDEGIVSINVGRRRRWNVPDEGDGFANEIDRNVESDRGLREAIRREPALFSKQRTTMMFRNRKRSYGYWNLMAGCGQRTLARGNENTNRTYDNNFIIISIIVPQLKECCRCSAGTVIGQHDCNVSPETHIVDAIFALFLHYSNKLVWMLCS